MSSICFLWDRHRSKLNRCMTDTHNANACVSCINVNEDPTNHVKYRRRLHRPSYKERQLLHSLLTPQRHRHNNSTHKQMYETKDRYSWLVISSKTLSWRGLVSVSRAGLSRARLILARRGQIRLVVFDVYSAISFKVNWTNVTRFISVTSHSK